jgi:hypothetical protein
MWQQKRTLAPKESLHGRTVVKGRETVTENEADCAKTQAMQPIQGGVPLVKQRGGRIYTTLGADETSHYDGEERGICGKLHTASDPLQLCVLTDDLCVSGKKPRGRSFRSSDTSNGNAARLEKAAQMLSSLPIGTPEWRAAHDHIANAASCSDVLLRGANCPYLTRKRKAQTQQLSRALRSSVDWAAHSQRMMGLIQYCSTDLGSLTSYIEETLGMMTAAERHQVHVSVRRTWKWLGYHWAQLQKVLGPTEEMNECQRDDRSLLKRSSVLSSLGLPELKQVWHSARRGYEIYFERYEAFEANYGTTNPSGSLKCY